MGKPDSDVVFDDERRIILHILNEVHANAAVSQRSIAGNVGIALGLTNAYLRRCIKKGFIKVKQAPAKRYFYYLTPRGFAEKSQLTASYLSQSFQFFRDARAQSTALLEHCGRNGWSRVVVYGAGDLAEIMKLCAQGMPVELCGVVDPDAASSNGSAPPVARDFAAFERIDAVLIAHLGDPLEAYRRAAQHFPAERILAPAFFHLGEPPPQPERG